MVKQKINERRSADRAKRVLSIQYRLVEKGKKAEKSEWHLSATEDMSYGGLSFLCDKELKVGSALELHVVMSGVLDVYNGLGKVIRTERKKTGAYYKIAVKFVQNITKKRSAKTYKAKKKAVKKRV